jgi:F-type H+-transporting ATPase subunit gamma
MEWEGLFAALLHEAMLVHLRHVFAQTMASVAASRLAAMDAAQRDIEDRLDRLRTEHQLVRQTEITEELLDVVSGFEVLHGE